MNTTLPPVKTVPARDGTPLAFRRWPPPSAARRGTILIVHGLGEHCGRYGGVADDLRGRGWAVVAYDQRGHGLAGGERGGLRRPDDLLLDLATIVDHVHTGEPGIGAPHPPLLLLGHSMGGVLAAQFVARSMRPVDGLVLSSPALDPGLSRRQRIQLAIGSALVPGLAQSNQLDPTRISHDPAVVRAYIEDPLVHDRVTARLARAIVHGGAEVLRAASAWQMPTLLMWAGSDRLVSPAGSAAFAAAAPASLVHAKCFEPLYHEILNEADVEPVLAELHRWLDRHYPAG
ncbi:MAG: lysophospholipase [Gemmatimonadota bacterium]|nr:lysophospholipase [Gemmatimonadota bacterium]